MKDLLIKAKNLCKYDDVKQHINQAIKLIESKEKRKMIEQEEIYKKHPYLKPKYANISPTVREAFLRKINLMIDEEKSNLNKLLNPEINSQIDPPNLISD